MTATTAERKTRAERRPRYDRPEVPEPLSASGQVLQPWQVRIVGKLLGDGGESSTRELLDLVVGTKPVGWHKRRALEHNDVRKFIAWLVLMHLARPDPCPRCPKCTECGSVVVTDEPALRRIFRWSQQQAIDRRLAIRAVADATVAE